MKRDMDLVRELLLKLEALDIRPGVLRTIHPTDPKLAVEGSSADEIAHHLRMLVDGGLINVDGNGFAASSCLLFRLLTWAGRDFLDSVRDPKIWDKTEKGAEADVVEHFLYGGAGPNRELRIWARGAPSSPSDSCRGCRRFCELHAGPLSIRMGAIAPDEGASDFRCWGRAAVEFFDWLAARSAPTAWKPPQQPGASRSTS